jgi:hypothetical protein
MFWRRMLLLVIAEDMIITQIMVHIGAIGRRYGYIFIQIASGDHAPARSATAGARSGSLEGGEPGSWGTRKQRTRLPTLGAYNERFPAEIEELIARMTSCTPSGKCRKHSNYRLSTRKSSFRRDRPHTLLIFVPDADIQPTAKGAQSQLRVDGAFVQCMTYSPKHRLKINVRVVYFRVGHIHRSLYNRSLFYSL